MLNHPARRPCLQRNAAGPIRRPSARAQAVSEAVDRLVMERVDAELGSAQRRREPAAGKNRDGMGRNTPVHGLPVLDRIAHDIRQVLV